MRRVGSSTDGSRRAVQTVGITRPPSAGSDTIRAPAVAQSTGQSATRLSRLSPTASAAGNTERRPVPVAKPASYPMRGSRGTPDVPTPQVPRSGEAGMHVRGEGAQGAPALLHTRPQARLPPPQPCARPG